MDNVNNDIISQRKFLNDVKKVKFHLQCLEDSREAAQDDALEEYCGINSWNTKIEAYRKIFYLDNIMDRTEIALEECTMLDLASQYVSQLQLEGLRLGMMNNRLNEENDWLAKANQNLKSKINELNSNIMSANKDMQQYRLICEFRQTETFGTESKVIGASIERDLEVDKNIMANLSSQIKAFYPLALQYINSSRYEVAVALCKHCQSDLKLKQTDEAMINYIMALAAIRQRNSDEAVRLFELACQLMVASQSKNSICLVPFLVGYGKALRLAKRYSESLVQMKAALELKQGANELKDEEVWNIKVGMASNLIKMNQSKEAAQLLFETLSEATSAFSSQENIIILIKNYLARSYLEIGQSDEALGLITRVFADAFENEGYPSIPSVLNNPGEFGVYEGADLLSVCQQSNDLLEIFTCQTLDLIYLSIKEEDSARILEDYIRIHSINFEIE